MSLKNVMIFGDSYSTFGGIIPKGYAAYYSEENHPESGVDTADKTWWMQLINETDSNLIMNNSWSGSTIGYTGYNNNDCSQTSSFIYRLRLLKEQGFFEENEINTVFVFGGTNDNWCGAPLGELKFSDWEESDLYSVLPAIPHFFKSLQDTLPDADIYCLINTELKPEITEGMKTACEKLGIKAIKFEYIDKINGHPTYKGMTDIKEQILKALND